ncbi:MAG: amino acid ABC transporter permease [Propylenella sp.]
MAIDHAGRLPVESEAPAKAFFLNNPAVRGFIVQTLLVAGLVAFIAWIVLNTAANLQRANIASGYDFLDERAGFEIGQSPVAYTPDRSYAYALYVGLLNTLMVAILGIVTATLVGFLVGIGRLSSNWLIRQLCTIYVEVFRNIPPLLVILFWYFGVIAVLPSPRDAIDTGIGISLSNRGAYMPKLVFEPGAWLVGVAFLLAIAVMVVVSIWARQRQMETGRRPPALQINLALFFGLPLLAYVLAGAPLGLEVPEETRFGLRGGAQVAPEFLALFLALSVYTASFIAEIVRAGILAVSHGQTEAGYSLGLKRGQTLRLVIIPQAFRVIIPPLTSQYLNLTKNSSLAIAVGYPDLVAVGGTILNQTGQAVEVVSIWMLVYLSISLITSLFMNWFNRHVALVER